MVTLISSVTSLRTLDGLHIHHDSEYMSHKWLQICSFCRIQNKVLSPFMTYQRVCNMSTMTSATSRAETAYPSGTPEFTPVFSKCSVS